MMPTQLSSSRGQAKLLSAENIARICKGRVLRQGRPAQRLVIDSRELRSGDCFVALTGDRFDGHDYVLEALAKGASGAIVSSSVARSRLPAQGFLIKVADTQRALLDLATEYRSQHKAKVVGITGSCGKTSTKDILGHVLAQQFPTLQSPKSFNNHIGVPLTLFALKTRTKAAVVEIGSNAPGEISNLAKVVQPDIAIITGVAEGHLEGLGNLMGVAKEKASLLQHLRKGGLAILNGDDQACVAMQKETPARCSFVRVDREADWFATDVQFHGLGTSFRLQGETPVTLPRMGSHNVYNALFSIAAASQLGVPMPVILQGLSEIPPTSRRLECKEIGDIKVVDDTYNSNPASARAALLAMAGMPCKGRRIVVLGEMLELGEQSDELHRAVGMEVAKTGVDCLVTVGDGAIPIAEAARQGGMAKRAVIQAADVFEATEQLHKLLRRGDSLLCKASRKIGLERLVDELSLRLDPFAGR